MQWNPIRVIYPINISLILKQIFEQNGGNRTKSTKGNTYR